MSKKTLKLGLLQRCSTSLSYLSLSLSLLTCPLASAAGQDHSFLENGYPTSFGSDLGYLLDTPTRVKIDLSGEWEYAVEGGPTGTVQIPAAADFTGSVAFKRTFDVPSQIVDAYRFHLVVLGANYDFDVYVNGEFVGNHAGGYTSFVLPLPESILQTGPENVIEAIVDNRLDSRNTVPTRQHVWGWRNYGGITRDVYLLGTPNVFISDARITSEVIRSGRSAVVHVNATIEEDWRGLDDRGESPRELGFFVEVVERMTGEVKGRSGVVQVPTGTGSEVAVEAELSLSSPALWSPTHPDLYMVRCNLLDGVRRSADVIDRYDVNVGIRTLELSDGDILLNGKRLVLNGVVWYEDHPTWGSALSYEERERDIVLMKNMGANAVRFAN
ncbi:MAG: beta galactosidase jelly roll domain-containing protein, partial [Bacteroidetes bacterium]|nr:beta galactosidase jelly roll domain-containing protein [Bacteroidota bacterium]